MLDPQVSPCQLKASEHSRATSPSGPSGIGDRALGSGIGDSDRVLDLVGLEPARKRKRPDLELDRHALVGPRLLLDPAGQDQVPEVALERREIQRAELAPRAGRTHRDSRSDGPPGKSRCCAPTIAPAGPLIRAIRPQNSRIIAFWALAPDRSNGFGLRQRQLEAPARDRPIARRDR